MKYTFYELCIYNYKWHMVGIPPGSYQPLGGDNVSTPSPSLSWVVSAVGASS